ncbi:Succinyl-CoA:(R)-benzylsuccinate CoA-transferase subunit BbsF [Falsiruegeria litorea R37]|uniref:Succinyl-CoA:(R)-benzylsuccinate CoA-transferase subunit BbsF n=1 Tax=Falsiruegeria litorea R37 TaxID=1200284 RepID=A0A1Y5T704_9RHOB|nr:CoA transferase [Falsiruegeria litorea]SLN56998.1 Succinyl-CoA:(R)-benzylsuccinate CoA-transferase subunit BbsF [Falsiruegeria litorea R37]
MSLPLTGIKVIDFTHVLAGPACGYYLGLLGAEVIKVESVGRGDSMRYRGGTDPVRAAEGMSTAYITQGSGKKSVEIDLASDAGKVEMFDLLESADVFVENHLPETMRRLGLDEKRTARFFPRLVHCSMTGYGRGGDRENAPAYDVNIQAVCGIMTMTGTAESGPLRTGAPIMDYSVALAAGFAISAALYQREQTGKGTFIDVSMLETAFTLMSSTITDYKLTGNVPKPRGNAANSRSPGAGSFDCKQGVLSLGVNEESQFQALARVLQREDWLTGTKFATRQQRTANKAELEHELASILLTRTADEWEADMISNGVPAARVRTMPEALALPQVEARGYLHTDPETGAVVPTLPFRIGDSGPFKPVSSAPRLGQNNG